MSEPTCVDEQGHAVCSASLVSPIGRGWPRLQAALSLLWCWRGVLEAPNEATSHIGARVGIGFTAVRLQLEMGRDEPDHLRRQPAHTRPRLEEDVGAGLHPPQREAQEAPLASKAAPLASGVG